jgi:copper oxidase (laccase) domain-containing protein
MNKIEKKLEWVVDVCMESWDFPFPFSEAEKTLDKLLFIKWKIQADSLIAIRWSKHTTNIDIYNAAHLKEEILFLDPGIDGVIVTDLNKIKKKISIILWTADCAPMLWVTRWWNTMLNLHGGYKGILWLEDNLIWIIWQLVTRLKELQLEPEDISLFIGPMAWAQFELPRDYFENISEDFFVKHETLDYENYFKENENKWKWYFDLKNLILDTLYYYGFKHIDSSQIETNNENNTWYSHRLFSNGKQDLWWRISSTISNKS